MVKREANGKLKETEAVFEDLDDEEIVTDEEEEDEDEEESCEDEDISEEGNDEEEMEADDGTDHIIEGGVFTAEQWLEVIARGTDGLVDIIKRRIPQPFVQASLEAPWEPTDALNELIKSLFLHLANKNTAHKPKQLRQLGMAVFARVDVFNWVGKAAEEQFKSFPSSPTAWKNTLAFIKATPLPNENWTTPLFESASQSQARKFTKENKGKILAKAFEEFVLAMTKQQLPTVINLSLMSWLSGAPMEQLPRPQLMAQFFFANFSKGSTHAIFALEGLFQLVVKHNFEHPRLFEEVYALTTPSSFYLNHKKKFLDLLDMFLSSTHLSTYIVAAFIKKLSRCLLYVPFDIQESLMGLIRNAITRHPTTAFLMHRDLPESITSDLFDEDEKDLQKTRAMESSLWEVKTLQAHFLYPVAKRARFIDAPKQDVESFIRFRDAEGYWNDTMTRAFGAEVERMDVQERNMMEEDGEERLRKKVRIIDQKRFPLSRSSLKRPFCRRKRSSPNTVVCGQY
ncbi:hypothetical protein PFISCL1PPCAC_11330, partial [Pristionchus fissidentatus]